MAFVVPTVARFAVNQTMNGRAVVNVLDYSIDTTGSTMSRVDAVTGQAQSIIDQWVEQFLPNQSAALSFDSVSFVDLNSPTGATGTVLATGSNALPISGGDVSAPLPPNVSVLITKQATAQRGARNGRMFLAGLGENATNVGGGQLIGPVALGVLQADADAFLANTNENDALGTAFSSEMVVVTVTSRSTPTPPKTVGDPLTGTGRPVDSLVVDALLATQRRRLRG